MARRWWEKEQRQQRHAATSRGRQLASFSQARPPRISSAPGRYGWVALWVAISCPAKNRCHTSAGSLRCGAHGGVAFHSGDTNQVAGTGQPLRLVAAPATDSTASSVRRVTAGQAHEHRVEAGGAAALHLLMLSLQAGRPQPHLHRRL